MYQINKKRIRIEHCPTTAMLGDFFTKPLQGSLFMNYDAGCETAAGQECVGTSRNKSYDTPTTTPMPSSVGDVTSPTVGTSVSDMPTEGDGIHHASSTHLHVLDPKRVNEQSHAHVPRLTQNHEQKQTESDNMKDRIQPQENENPRHPSQF